MYIIDVLYHKWKFITNIRDLIIPEDCCDKNKYAINFSTDGMVEIFEEFADAEMKKLYFTASMSK